MGATGRAEAARKLLRRSGIRRPQWEAAPDRPAQGWNALTQPNNEPTGSAANLLYSEDYPRYRQVPGVR